MLLREKRDEEGKAERHLVRSVIEQWSGLKAVRRRQGYQNTDLKLLIHKESVKQSEDIKNWKQHIER